MENEISQLLLLGSFCVIALAIADFAMRPRDHDAATFERWNIVKRVVPDENFEADTRAFAERLASGATLAYAAGKKFVQAYPERGIRAADALVDEIAPSLFETADMRAGVDGLIEHGPRQFRNKVIFEGR